MPGLLAAGWRPTPAHDLVLKVHQRCNLACDYCYVYEHADQSWRGRPAVMPEAVWRAAAAALGRHARRHDLRSVRVVLHGGEPLLAGVERLGAIVAAVRAALPERCTAEIGMQTNGVRLDARTAGALVRHGIRAGVSVDGVAADHDRHRRTRGGRGSFAMVARALEVLQRPAFAAAYAGLLCTVAPDTDPVATHRALAAFRPPVIDYLLPHANWGQPPPGRGYGEWLIAAFDTWYDDPPGCRVRLFEDAVALFLGGTARGEQLGLAPAALLVVESDGALEQVDALKSAYPGAAATGRNVLHDEFDDVLLHPGVVARQIGVRALAPPCLACPVHRVCGGGHYAHRYRPGAGFRNPSVHCAALTAFLTHVRGRLAADLVARPAVDLAAAPGAQAVLDQPELPGRVGQRGAEHGVHLLADRDREQQVDDAVDRRLGP